MKTLFIHRSVGRNLIDDGGLYELFDQTPIQLNDYDHNTLSLGDGKGSKHLGLSLPGNDTHPEHYARFFGKEGAKHHKKLLDIVLGYDLVIIKSCYPNSNISSDEELEQVQAHYKSIANYFNELPKKNLVILTSPPLIPLRTSKQAAARARTLSSWLAATGLGKNVTVFDFYNYLATGDDRPGANMLRKEYRRLLPVDAHPNARASKEIAAKLVDAVLAIK